MPKAGRGMGRKVRAPAPRSAEPPHRAWFAIPVTAALLYVGLAVHAAWVETPTVDEFAHLPAGCAYWRFHEFDLYAKNPPLLKYWMALPVVVHPAARIPPPAPRAVASQGWGPWIYGLQFMNENREHYFRLFFLGRLPIVLLGLLTGVVLFYWCRELHGARAACVVAAAFLLTPTVLAHGHLATIDVGCMFGMFLAVFVFRWAWRRSSWWCSLVAGSVFGVALLIKFTAVFLAPVFVLFALLFKRPGSSRSMWYRLRVPATVFLTALAVVNLLMGFRGSFKPLGGYVFRSSLGKSVQAALPKMLPVPLPESYVVGFDVVKRDTEGGEFGNYLMGRWSREGWWYYNFVALAVKEPLPFLLMSFAGVTCWLRLRYDRGESIAVFVPLAVFLLVMSVGSRLNTGIRYVLPVFPFLFLVAGSFWRWSLDAVRYRLAGVLVASCLGYYATLVAVTHPSYLSFFNLIAGGASGGDKWLLDSNIDWGQDLYRVAGAAKRLAGEKPVGLLYFGHVDPELYGITYGLVPPAPVEGILAVSVNYFRGMSYVITFPDGKCVTVGPDHLNWLRSTRPIERLGSILLFDTRGPHQRG